MSSSPNQLKGGPGSAGTMLPTIPRTPRIIAKMANAMLMSLFCHCSFYIVR